MLFGYVILKSNLLPVFSACDTIIIMILWHSSFKNDDGIFFTADGRSSILDIISDVDAKYDVHEEADVPIHLLGKDEKFFKIKN